MTKFLIPGGQLLRSLLPRFRPISCTSVVSKTLERLILSHFAFSLNLADVHQFTYRSSKSTDSIHLIRTHFICLAVDEKNKRLRICFLGYGDVFNCINRSKPLLSLSHSGVGKIVSLADSTSSVTTALPPLIHILVVPHGAILSPFIFSA